MSELYKKSYRGYLIDHHSPDPPIVTLENINIDEYKEFYKKANINNLMVYCKDHWGVTYYKSKYGRMHPGLKEDWLAKVRTVLKELKIEFNAYYCVEYDNLAPQLHPEWSIRKADNSPFRCEHKMAKWRMPCYETGYREYMMGQLVEIVEGYKPDSLFLDIFGKTLCYCAECKNKFISMYGYEMPALENATLAQSRDTLNFLNKCAKDMLQEIVSTLKRIDSSLKITINFAALYPKEIRDLLDYQFTEPWAGNWLSGAYSRDTSIEQYPQLGPGNVSEVYNYKPQNIYMLAAAQIAAQNCRVFLYSGSQHPDGTLEHEESIRIGKAYNEIAKIEKYLGERKIISDICIVQSDESSRLILLDKIEVDAVERLRGKNPHRDALLGAMKLCDYIKYTWNIVPEQNISLEKLSNYKMVILPEVYFISQGLADILKEYVSNGGIVVSGGKTGLYDSHGNLSGEFKLKELYGCDYVEDFDKYHSSNWGSYLNLTEDNVWIYSAKTYPPVESVRIRISNKTATPLATFVNPAVELTGETWVNWWCPPPATNTSDIAITDNSFGKGKVIYAAFNMFNMENNGFEWLKYFFKGIMDKYVPLPKLRLDTHYPRTVQYVAYDREKDSEIIIHDISQMAALTGGDANAIDGGELRLNRLWKTVEKAIVVYPQHKELTVQSTENEYIIKLPEIVDIQNIIVIKYKE